MRFNYAIKPLKIGLILGVIALYLAVQSFVAEYVLDIVPRRETNWQILLVIDLFSVNAEATIPTWYSTILLFAASVLFALIAATKRASQDRYARHWIGLAAIFFYLSMDEGAVIHEIIAEVMQQTPNATGYLAFGWQIVAAPLVLIFALLYLRFLSHLPSRTRNWLILAAVLYVGGALVVEAVSANQWYLDGGVTIEYLAIGTVEELGEMLGAVVLIYTLLSYVVEQEYVFVFHSPSSAQESAAQAMNDTVAEAAHSSVAIEPAGSRRIVRALSPRRPVIVLGGVLIGMNLLLLSWAWAQASTPEQVIQNPMVSAQAVIDQVITSDVQVTRMVGRFGVDNPRSRQVAAALLRIFDEVMVVTSASVDSSIVLAGDALPFDRNSLADTLSANGVTQFIIFDTAAVKALVGNIQQETQNE